MATDATGTPTSPDNIPTYNVSVDAPSGLGFNAAMALIQTALSKRASSTDTAAVGEVPVYDGSAWQYQRLELGYGEATTDTSITATTQGTANTVCTASAFTAVTGDVVKIHVFSPNVVRGTNWIKLVVFEDGVAVKDTAYATLSAGSQNGFLRRAPAAGSRTYSLRAYVDAGTGSVGATSLAPAFIWVTRV